MSVYKLKGSWWVDFTYEHERLRKRSPLNTRGGACEYEVHLRKELARHGSLDAMIAAQETFPAPRRIAFAEFAEMWLREYVDVNNKPTEQRAKRVALRNHLLPEFGTRSIGSITALDIEHLKARLEAKGLSAKSRNNYLTVLRTCLSAAVEWKVITAAPQFKLFKRTRPPFHYLSQAELTALLAALTRGVLRSLVLTASQTGLRFCELIALRWDDVDFDAGMICVCRSEVRGVVGTPKSDRIRYVPLTPDVRGLLLELERNGPLVFQRCGRSVKYVCARDQLAAACESAGVPHASWHTLRHTFASHLVAARAPIKAVQELLGHSSLEMTLRYSHLNADDLRAAVSLLAPAPAAAESATAGGQPDPVSTDSNDAMSVLARPILRSIQQKTSRCRDVPSMVGVDGVEPS